MKISNTLSFVPIIIAFLLIACEENVKELPPSEIYINMPEDGYELRVTDTLVISPKITYDYNSTYIWKLDGEIISSEKDLTLIPQILNYYSGVFIVENDRGIDSIDIWAQSMYITDFKDLALEEDSFWVNPNTQEYFISDNLKFEVNESENDELWTGFTYSNLVGNNTIDNYEKYSSYNSPSSYESVNFGVMIQDNNHTPLIIETKDGENHLFKSIMVNNSYYVYDAIKFGNNESKIFGGEDGIEIDWLILTITGFNKSGTQGGTVEFYLADYTFGNNRNNYIITNWSPIDLISLGEVSKLELKLTSSDVVDGKMMTPGFVCIDVIKIIE